MTATAHRHYWHPVSKPLQLPDPDFDAIVGIYPLSITAICECGAVDER